MTTRAALRYAFLNALFHLTHLGIILFVMLAWLVPALLPWHLLLTALTLGCWFVLGLWMGPGYCPVSDWHWRIKQSLGEGRPAASYIHFVLQKITRRQFDGSSLDRLVVAGTLLVAAISLWRNWQLWHA